MPPEDPVTETPAQKLKRQRARKGRGKGGRAADCCSYEQFLQDFNAQMDPNALDQMMQDPAADPNLDPAALDPTMADPSLDPTAMASVDYLNYDQPI